MHCPACQYPFTFFNALAVVSPFHCTCPACKAKLTMGKQGVGFTLAAALGGAAFSVIGICMEQSRALSKMGAIEATALLFLIAAGIGEWYCWRYGVLQAKSLRPS